MKCVPNEKYLKLGRGSQKREWGSNIVEQSTMRALLFEADGVQLLQDLVLEGECRELFESPLSL